MKYYELVFEISIARFIFSLGKFVALSRVLMKAPLTVTCYDWLTAEQYSIPLVLCSLVSVTTTGFELCSSHGSSHTVPSYIAYDTHTLQHTVQSLLHYIVLRKNGFSFSV